MINCNLVWMETEASRRQEEVARAMAMAKLLAEASAPREASRPTFIGLRRRVGHGLIATGERVAGRPLATLREAA